MDPKECRFKQSETACGLCSPATARDGDLIVIYKHSIFVIMGTQFTISTQVTSQPNCTENLHVDVTILIRSFGNSFFYVSDSNYACHVGLAEAKP